MAWWRGQNLNKPIRAQDGCIWYFRVWHGFETNEAGWKEQRQRIFFWNDEKSIMGRIQFKSDQVLHVSKVKQRMIKIMTEENYRSKHLEELHFPIEKNY